MDIELNLPVFISGNPNEEEMVAISAAYSTLLLIIGDNPGENSVDSGSGWGISSKIGALDVKNNSYLAGKTTSWQQNLRLASRI